MECDRTGRIRTNGNIVPGYRTSYIVDHGAAAKERDSLGDGWHVRAVHSCNSGTIMWYELYDSQDGDYYGWVDSYYINLIKSSNE